MSAHIDTRECQFKRTNTPEERTPPLTQFMAALGTTPEERRDTLALFHHVLPLLETEGHGVPEVLEYELQGCLIIAAHNLKRAKETAIAIRTRLRV